MKKTDKGILLITLILVGIGLIMVYSSSAFSSLRVMNTSTFFFKKQLIPLGIGVVLCFTVSKIDYRIWGKYSYLILGITILLLFWVLLFSQSVHGTKRWIRFSNSSLKWISFQPAEFAKLGVIIFIANFISRQTDGPLRRSFSEASGQANHSASGGLYTQYVSRRINFVKFRGLYLSIALAIVFLLIALEPSFGVLFAICVTCLIILFLGNFRITWLLLIFAGVFGAGFLLINHSPYAKLRMANFFSHEGYQLRQSIYGIGAGGLFGAGLGNGKAKLFFLPEPHTDFIFSIIGEELGFIGCAIVSVLFLILLIRGIKIGIRQQADKFGFLLAVGISFIIFVSAGIHIGVTCGILPITGIPLPFISFGGSNLLSNLIGIGILLNISRQRQRTEDR